MPKTMLSPRQYLQDITITCQEKSMPKTMLSPRQYLQDITITCQEKSMPKNDVTAKAISQTQG